MKPNALTSSPVPITLGAVLPTARIITHPRSKKATEIPAVNPPDEETLLRLNAMASQHPFCVRHKGKDHLL